MAIQKKTEGRDLEEYLQEVWDSLEPAWDKSKFDMKQDYDSEYECDCITITSKDNEGVLAKIYVNDYEGKHPVGFDVVYRYPGDKGVGVMGSYEFQSTDMDGLGEEVFDYFDEIKKKAAGASFESDLQAYADAVKADKYDKQSVIEDGWDFDNSVEYDDDIVRDNFKKKYDGKTYLLHITFNPSTKDVSDVKWDISAVESKKTEEAGSFKVGDFVNYDAESDGKDAYDSFIPCEVVDVNDDGTLGLCVYGSYADEEGLGENASASCCSKLDHYAGMVDANTYYTDGKYKAYKGGWEILVTEKELDPSVYEFIGSMDDLSEVVDFDDYYGGENFVYDEDLRDDLGATGVDTDGVDFADMSGDVAKASGSPEESKKSESDNDFWDSIKNNPVAKELLDEYDRVLKKVVAKVDKTNPDGPWQDEFDSEVYSTENAKAWAGHFLSLYGKDALKEWKDCWEPYNEPVFKEGDKLLSSALSNAAESKKSEGLPPKKLGGNRKYRSRADLINKMKALDAVEITTPAQFNDIHNKQWLHTAGYAMDINGNRIGQTYFGDKDGKWYYATTKTFQGDYLPECKEEAKKSEDGGKETSALLHLNSKGDSSELDAHEFLDDLYLNNRERLGGFVRIHSKDLGATTGVYAASTNPEVLAEYLKLYAKEYIVRQDMHDGNWTEAVDVLPYILDCLQELVRKGGVPCKEQGNDTLVANGVSATIGNDGTIYVKDRTSNHTDGCDSTKDAAARFVDTWRKYNLNQGEAKKSESLTLKQKELKDMVRFGQAEDITTISDEEAKALRKKGIETVGVSRGTYGMNGALLRDSEGKKYVITARSSNLFYFV